MIRELSHEAKSVRFGRGVGRSVKRLHGHSVKGHRMAVNAPSVAFMTLTAENLVLEGP